MIMYFFSKCKKQIFKFAVFLFLVLHMTSILIHATVSNYLSYQEFYHLKQASRTMEILQYILNTKLYKHYGFFSGTQTGYGFFAPNVRSSSILFIEGCEKKVIPVFETQEGKQRFDAYVGDYINTILEDDKQQKDSVLTNLLDRYSNLTLKNIALKALKDNKVLCDSLTINYCVLDFPTMKQARETGNASLTITPIKVLSMTKFP